MPMIHEKMPMFHEKDFFIEEEKYDWTKICCIVLQGRPITKKNHNRIIRVRSKLLVIPSKQFKVYEKESLKQLKKVSIKFGNSLLQLTAKYFLNNKRGFPDLNNLLQASTDILEKSGIINNDRNIVSYDGSRILIDKNNARAELFLIPIKEI